MATPSAQVRERLNYEAAKRVLRGARCSVCHRRILETEYTTYLIHRRARFCRRCTEEGL